MRLREMCLGAVALAVLMGLFFFGRASVVLSSSNGSNLVPNASKPAPADGESYPTKLARLWVDIINLNQGMLDKVNATEPGHLSELAALGRTQREELQRLYGRVEGLTCPPDLAEQRENMLSGIKSDLAYCEHLTVIAEKGGTPQDFADLASSAESAIRYYGKAKLSGWRNFPDEVFAVKGKIDRLVKKTQEAKLDTSARARVRLSPPRQDDPSTDPMERAYLEEVRGLVESYESTRGQFSRELQSGFSGDYTTAGAYRARQSILERLNRLEPVPPRFVGTQATFTTVVQEGLDAVKSYYFNRDRYALAQASARISARLRTVKEAIGTD